MEANEQVKLGLQEHQDILNKIQALEKEVSNLTSQKKNKRSVLLAVKKSLRSFFSRDNLELFLSLTSLAISVCVVIYLVFE